MRHGHPRHGLGVQGVAEDLLLATPLQQLGHDVGGELRVALHGEEPVGDVHAVDEAGDRGTEGFDARRVVANEVFVHLV